MLVPFALLSALVAVAPATETQKIEALIQAVAGLQEAVFIRNGSEHPPKEAAEHLRLKWGNAGRHVKTAPDFIRLCASESSLSSKPYEIRFKDGRSVRSRDWLWTELKRLEAAP